ncbi:MAG: N-acetyl-gamma-glutamyl-phosphate reductase [Rhodospirillaceae bacterium]
MNKTTFNVAILGASGYTGAELIRILALHPNARIFALSADRRAGEEIGSVFPHLGGLGLPKLQKVDEINFDNIDFVFCALPHGTTHEIVQGIPERIKVVDLSPDFRLGNVSVYEEWYAPHRAPSLQGTAIYGLPEIRRENIKKARLVANPGCYPTASILPLAPLLASGVISPADVIIDSKSGVSGAGRAEKEANLFAEVADGIHAYGVGSHRHMPEIEQELSLAAGATVRISFTPHLMPMSRGILSSMYVQVIGGQSASGVRDILKNQYSEEKFVRIMDEGVSPATRHVRGSNQCLINVFDDRLPGRIIVVSAIDNLVKGASGQAIQNMNIMMGVVEDTAISQLPMFP